MLLPIYTRGEKNKLEKQDSLFQADPKFYIKMPEIGNMGIYDTDGNYIPSYQSGHSKFYVGSVIGKAIITSSAISLFFSLDFLLPFSYIFKF